MFVALELFLILNGCKLIADNSACILTMFGDVAGDINEGLIAEWIRSKMLRAK